MMLSKERLETPMTQCELVEFVLGCPPGCLSTGAQIRPLLEPFPIVGAPARERENPCGEARHKPAWARRQPHALPSEQLFDAARLHGRGREPRRVALATLARSIELDPTAIAEGLNRADLMLSLPVEDVPPDLSDWPRVFQLAAALGTASDEVRWRALTEYADGDMWDWAHLPLDARADELLGWLVGELMHAAPDRGAAVMTTLVNSPEAFRVTAGRVLRIFDQLDQGAFAPLVGVLARFSCYARLAQEDPVRRLVQEVVRYAIEQSGDSILAASGLELLLGGGFGGAPRPTSRDLALAATVATFVALERPGWRNPLLRPAMLEAALHGAPGCRRAALMLGAPQ